MYKIYFKQAIAMLKQNRFISIIAIMGTALAIMMIMSIIVVDEIQNISIAPEINRNRTYYVDRQIERDTVRNHYNSGYIDYKIYNDYFRDMKTPEYLSIVSSRTMLTGKEGSEETIDREVVLTDASFWKIMAFTFTEGEPFGEEESESGVAHAVISETTARKVFQGEQALGRIITINFEPYLVTGIVKDISPVFSVSHGDIWIPVTSQEQFLRSNEYTIILQAKDTKDFPEIDKEVRTAERKFGADNKNKVLSLRGPLSHKVLRMKINGFNMEETDKDLKAQNRKRLFIFIILLLIPAINLSGLSLSRMKKRTAEIGVRKAFGAKKHIILIQVLYENLITSLLGGFIGLVLSYLVVFQMKHWLLKIPAESALPGEAFVSFPVFLAVFVICVLINLLSAGIPAYRTSKLSIVNSLNENDK